MSVKKPWLKTDKEDGMLQSLIMSSEDAQRMSGQTSLMPGQTAPSPLLLPPDSDTPAPLESEENDDLMLR